MLKLLKKFAETILNSVRLETEVVTGFKPDVEKQVPEPEKIHPTIARFPIKTPDDKQLIIGMCRDGYSSKQIAEKITSYTERQIRAIKAQYTRGRYVSF